VGTKASLIPNLNCETRKNKNKNMSHVEQEFNKILLQERNKTKQ
jgi:hypothetical protein